jgi:hypothetical protein
MALIGQLNLTITTLSHLFHKAGRSAFIRAAVRVRAEAPVLDAFVLTMLLRRYSWMD